MIEFLMENVQKAVYWVQFAAFSYSSDSEENGFIVRQKKFK